MDGIIDELGLVPSDEMMADVLTKGGCSGEILLESVRNGKRSIAGGTMSSRSKKIETSTWRRLIQAQSGGFDTEEEAGLEAMIDINMDSK